MTQRYDLVIAGGGPSGSAAAWQAAQTGANVVVLDKAQFPRAKPCGDGLTARAVSYLQKMGLADEVATFHRVNLDVFQLAFWASGFSSHTFGSASCLGLGARFILTFAFGIPLGLN